MKAVVMAGGEGSRLRPITANRPKPLVPVVNLPIMQHIVALLKRHDIHEIVATLHYLADEISSYFDDGSDFGVSMHYSIEDTPLGTAGSVKQAEHLLRDDTFVIISGDAMTDCDLSKAIAFHKEKGSLATLVLYRVANPLEFGVVITDGDGHVTRFLEKPSWSEVFSDTVNTGIYILEPEIFDLMEPGRQYDWSQDIFPELLRQGKPIYGYVMGEYWCDVGNLTQYREAQEHLLTGQSTLDIPGDDWGEGKWIGQHTVIEDGVEITPPVAIGRNCKIKSGAVIGPHTVIGDNCLVESGATISRSVVWENCYVGPNVSITSAILGAKCAVKRDSVIQEEAVIGDRCLIDVGCIIRPRIKLWPDKVIERGSTVTMSLVWGSKWRGSLFRELGVAGLSNIELTPDFAARLGSAFGTTLPRGSIVITGRDSARSSRMLKRALMSSLLSVGCEVLDMRSTSAPVMRHFVRASGASGAVYVRKTPGNRRVSLIEFFDGQGRYLARGQERKVESAFFREDFHRVDPDDLGHIEFASRALEEYQSDFNRLVSPEQHGRRMKMVCDLGFSNIASMYPSMLARLNVEAINTNSFNDARMAPRSREDIDRHLASLQHIVGTLGYDMGVLFIDEGERFRVVDNRGRVVSGEQLLGAMMMLQVGQKPDATLALSVASSTALTRTLVAKGAKIIRSKADTRSLLSTAHDELVNLSGDASGGFIFPGFHAGFDAMFGVAWLVTMLQAADASLSEIVDQLPAMHLHQESVKCPWELKGAVMRRLMEEIQGEIETFDGIRVGNEERWVLVLPDSVEPLFHIHAEAGSERESAELAQEYAELVRQLQS